MSAIAQRSFVGGELSPSLYARTDVSKYATGLRTCRNFMVMRHGGVTNRPGTTFRAEVKDSSKTVRLLPFIFNSSQTYVLEFGNLYMRVFKSGSAVTLTAQNITAITNASPGVLTYSGADTYANGDAVLVTGVVGAIATHVNGRVFLVASVSTANNTFNLAYPDGTLVNTTTWGTYTSGGTIAEVYQITTPYVEADLQNLRFVESADVITIVHPAYVPYELARTADTTWTLTAITFAPTVQAPTGLSTSGAAGSTNYWVATAIDGENGEESLASSEASSSATPTSGTPMTISISGASGAPSFGGITPIITYNLYRKLNGIYGFIGSFSGTTFSDIGTTPDITINPPTARNPFGSSSNYPSCVTYHQSRILYGATTNQPETVYASQTGLFKNFTFGMPIEDSDALTWTMAGRQVNTIKHLLEMGKLLLFTSAGEWSVDGNASGILTPSGINPRQYSQNGCADIPPLVVGATAIYVQARGNIVRDLAFDFQSDGYRGNDLTIFSAHLFDGYTIRDWTYQQIPHSIIWAVRSDGVLLGLTYVREQELLAWHRHDLQDATVEQVCAVPEGTEDATYMVVKRTVNGSTKRYVERMETRQIDDIVDAIFMDCAFTYDGTNTGATTMTLSGGTAWTYDEQLTLTASASFFASTDVGNRIDLTSSAGDILRCTIIAYTSATVVTVNAHMTVPVLLRTTARTTWTMAVKAVSGLWHLEAKSVSAFGDGFVVANPNNSALTAVTVTNGIATFDKPYGVIHVGLPILADMETLDIDQAQGETLADKKKIITKVTAFLQESRGLWAGPKPPTDDTTNPVENLTELKIRNEENYDDPVALVTDSVDINIAGEANSNGRVFLRQLDPVPCSVLSVTPTGLVPYQRGG